MAAVADQSAGSAEPPPSRWFVYILRCANGCLYTGIATDVLKRLSVHNSGKGSAYVRAHRPATLVAYIESENRSTASALEYAVKAMTKAQKLALAKQWKAAAAREKKKDLTEGTEPKALNCSNVRIIRATSQQSVSVCATPHVFLLQQEARSERPCIHLGKPQITPTSPHPVLSTFASVHRFHQAPLSGVGFSRQASGGLLTSSPT